ncbi:sigma factor-like helix-turn-helix DNA-binding protein [Allokutzneria multivorans]|uniref:Sigma factor-like helix-turn-helix DNA-binding protein n=1 Tax=Allokutzneria multivorans TaxID=1142134 RepID=A0ABP7QTD6_9PSEU
MGNDSFEDLVRRLAPQVLGALVRRYGRFDAAEDAVQEALLVAMRQWREHGVPEHPHAWLLRVASRKLIDLLRAEQARRRREDVAASRELPSEWNSPSDDADDTLILLTLCCHPSLTPSSQIALTLRAVGGLTTAEIARSFLTSEASMVRRISRAKRTIEDSGVPFRMPSETERPQRIDAVLRVLYLIFTEGYSATSGPQLHRACLAEEAIRLAEITAVLLPEDGEVAGLLALMLLTDARAPARLNEHGELVPLHEQDRRLWKAESIRRGVDLITRALPRGEVGQYQLQAAIAAIHDEAPSSEATDWRQIVALYRLLRKVSPSPVVELNHAVAVAMADGPTAGLALLDALDDPRLARDRRLHAARAHLLELAGEPDTARAAYLRAAELATNIHHVRYLNARAHSLGKDTT